LFTNNGVPATGLTPAISGYNVSTDGLVFNDTMTEMPQGAYKYDFAAYDDSVDYSFIADGGATLADIDRWQSGSNDIGQVTNQNDGISAAQTVQFAEIVTHANAVSAEQTTQYTDLTNQADSISADQTAQYSNLYNQADAISADHTAQFNSLDAQADSISAAQTIQYSNLYNQADSISAVHTSELAIIAGLAQRNQRITHCAYGLSGELLSATLSIYGSKANAESQSSALTTFALSATYDGDINMTDYLVVEN
jgi:hypothetical protein